jgi:flagellar biosynthetic protein FliR
VSTTLINEVVRRFSTQQLVGFILVLARVSPLFVFAPLFSAKMLGPQVRTVVALGLSIGLTPIALAGQHLPETAAPLAGLVVESLLIGYAFAFSIGVLFAAVQVGGTLLDTQSGFSFGATVDPINGTQAAIFSQLYSMFGAIIFVVIGGDAWVLRGLARTFTLVPLSGAAKLGPIIANAAAAVASLLTSAIEVTAPILLAIIITDVAFGVVSRVVPQLNVFAVALPMKVAVALLTVSATLPFAAGWISNQLGMTVSAALNSIQAM